METLAHNFWRDMPLQATLQGSYLPPEPVYTALQQFINTRSQTPHLPPTYVVGSRHGWLSTTHGLPSHWCSHYTMLVQISVGGAGPLRIQVPHRLPGATTPTRRQRSPNNFFCANESNLGGPSKPTALSYCMGYALPV